MEADMSESPWTSEDPQPGDFDAELERADPNEFVRLAPNPDAKPRFVIDVDAEDFARLERISVKRGEAPREVISELLRDADRSAA